ncbi:hypothetical protein BH11PAT2_BH11PAT2_00650 [soil metagenome]
MTDQKLQRINIAYIDAANLDRSIRAIGWKLDYEKFRVWLSDKFKIQKAYIFIGLIPKYRDLYTYIQSAGFILVFKEVIYTKDGNIKGNCDTDLVLQGMEDAYEGNLAKALLVSSDGDYASFVKKLKSRDQLFGILSPSPANKCSILLKRENVRIWDINDQRAKLELKSK